MSKYTVTCFKFSFRVSGNFTLEDVDISVPVLNTESPTPGSNYT